MATSLKRRRLKRALFSPIIIVLLLVLTIFVAKAAWGMYEKEKKTERNLELSSVEFDELSERHNEIESQLAALQTNKGIEEEIRKRYGMVKEGERLIVIVDPEESEEEEKGIQRKSFLQKILDTFW